MLDGRKQYCEVREVLKGLLRDFVRTYGDAVLVTEKKQPFSRAHETCLESALLSGNVHGVSSFDKIRHCSSERFH